MFPPGKVVFGFFVTVLCSTAAGCIAPLPGVTKATVSAPPIAGTLYIEHFSGGNTFRPVLEIRRNGVVVNRRPPGAVLMARDKPSITLSSASLFGKPRDPRNQHGRVDPRSCAPVAISPYGTYAACLRSDGTGSVTIFRVAHPQMTQRDTRYHVSMNSKRMVAFVSDERLAIAADDMTCTAYTRSDSRYGFEPRARLYIVDVRGKKVSKGPCVHGLIVGAKKIAFVSHDSMQHPNYSFDGSSWAVGLATTFDGDDHLLVINEYDQLVDEQNRLVAQDVVDAQWTR